MRTKIRELRALQLLRDRARSVDAQLPGDIAYSAKLLLENASPDDPRRALLTQLRDKATAAKESVHDPQVVNDLLAALNAFLSEELRETPGGVPLPPEAPEPEERISCEACGHAMEMMPMVTARREAATTRQPTTQRKGSHAMTESAADVFKRLYREGNSTLVEAGRPIPKGASAAAVFALTGDPFDVHFRTQEAAAPPAPAPATLAEAERFIRVWQSEASRVSLVEGRTLVWFPRRQWRALLDDPENQLSAPWQSRSRSTYVMTHELGEPGSSYFEADHADYFDEPDRSISAARQFHLQYDPEDLGGV